MSMKPVFFTKAIPINFAEGMMPAVADGGQVSCPANYPAATNPP